MARRHSRGQIALILALVLPVVVGAVALGADFAVMYFNWVQLQTAADASAKAGADLIYGQSNTTGRDPQTNAQYYAEQNGIHDTNAPKPGNDVLSVDYPFTYQGNPAVQVTVTRQVPYLFGQLLGLKNATLSATAIAYVTTTAGTNATAAGISGVRGPTPPSSNVIPICIDCSGDSSQCQPGVTSFFSQAGSNTGKGSNYDTATSCWNDDHDTHGNRYSVISSVSGCDTQGHSNKQCSFNQNWFRWSETDTVGACFKHGYSGRSCSSQNVYNWACSDHVTCQKPGNNVNQSSCDYTGVQSGWHTRCTNPDSDDHWTDTATGNQIVEVPICSNISRDGSDGGKIKAWAEVEIEDLPRNWGPGGFNGWGSNCRNNPANCDIKLQFIHYVDGEINVHNSIGDGTSASQPDSTYAGGSGQVVLVK